MSIGKWIYIFSTNFAKGWVCLPSLTAPHLNFSILCVSSVEFQMENLRIYCENLGDFTLLFYRGRLRNVQSFRTHVLSYCSAH